MAGLKVEEKVLLTSSSYRESEFIEVEVEVEAEEEEEVGEEVRWDAEARITKRVSSRNALLGAKPQRLSSTCWRIPLAKDGSR